ncbi:MAG: cbb3-type cytochrome oxidase assembly protein CcoS [Glaciecola sp.]|jgi:cbb3-type cytochrome oxidase maturation protein|nr:cbb3-type cytochrome oxidase assembly protein CcoS [Glaciecola sp.]MDG1814826.1 cbb3-type cytochrome oxidase assembly protein CcoS [Glaciecola sp.]MDG2098971.1 cbb3-type cytochrome oxidase assembly protein CcoS [Glaciecola sp.]
MNVIYVLIPIAIIIVAIALLVFFWAVKANQFDDLERQGSAILFDDDVTEKVPSTHPSQKPDPTIVDHLSDNQK